MVNHIGSKNESSKRKEWLSLMKIYLVKTNEMMTNADDFCQYARLGQTVKIQKCLQSHSKTWKTSHQS